MHDGGVEAGAVRCRSGTEKRLRLQKAVQNIHRNNDLRTQERGCERGWLQAQSVVVFGGEQSVCMLWLSVVAVYMVGM